MGPVGGLYLGCCRGLGLGEVDGDGDFGGISLSDRGRMVIL